MADRSVRTDPLTGEHVVIASVRAGHAREAGEHGAVDLRAGEGPADCPFCPGNEHATHPSILEIRSEGAWVARAFANRCPVLVIEAPGAEHGLGAHEVLVESPDHSPLHHQAPGRSRAALELARARLLDLASDTRLAALTWFRNHGAASGGSQRHPHAQIVGLPFVPERWARYAGRSREHNYLKGRPLLTTVLEQEHADGRRVLETDGPVTALCAPAPSHPFELWFVPERPGPRLADATDDELDALSRLMPRWITAIEAAVGRSLSYTATVLGAAEGDEPAGVGWHLRVLPRLGRQGGLERGAGVMVHGVFPEEAARALRHRVAPR